MVCLIIEMRELTFDKDLDIPVIKIYRQMLNLLPTHRNPPRKITGIGIPPVTSDKGECINITHVGDLGTFDQYTPWICAV